MDQIEIRQEEEEQQAAPSPLLAPQPQQPPQEEIERPAPAVPAAPTTPPQENGELMSESEESPQPSVLEVPAINWSQYTGCKNVQYIRMVNAPKVSAEENWDTAQTVRDVEK